MYKVKNYFAAPNLWCVYDDESGDVVFINIYKCECELKARELNNEKSSSL
jgi:hypothetical protein